MLAKEIAELLDEASIGIFSTADPATRTIFVGEIPQDVTEGIMILMVPSPPPHQYIDTEYTVLDFWARSPHTDRAYNLLEQVFELLHRKYAYDTAHWHVFLSQALGSIMDVDRDGDGGKLVRLSVQFICRNLNHVS